MALVGRKRARASDRDEAVEVINTAYAEGQLTEEQREDRVHRALLATHVGDLHQVVSDLQPHTGDQVGEARGPLEAWWERTAVRTKVAVGGALLVLVVGGVGAVQVWGDDDQVAVVDSGTGYTVPATAEALTDLVDDHEDEFGTTKSYGVSLQAQLSMIRVPTDDGRARFQEWRPTRDGGFEPMGEVRGAGEYRELDLADLDLTALERNLDTAWETLGVPDPTYATIVVEHWDQHEQPRVTLHVTNDFEEYGYLVTDLDGTVLDTVVFDPSAS